MKTSEAINELAAALAKAQGQIEGASKTSNNPYFKSKYADLASVWDACRKPLTDNGLSVLQSPGSEGVRVMVTTRLMHASGQWIEGVVSTDAKDASPQSVGSAVTYLRRYSLQSFVGVAPEDDDGEAAQGRTPAKAEPPKPPKGYQEWIDSLKATAKEGLPSLQIAWGASSKELRSYVSVYSPQTMEAIKADAAKVAA